VSTERVASCDVGSVGGPARVILWSRAKSRRGLDENLYDTRRLGPVERPRRPASRGAKVREGSSTNVTILRTLARL
jgi:hypothetical protein